MRILNAPEGEKLLTLDPPGGLVGRSTDSALVLGYDSVSRLHAELRHDGKDWWLHQRSQTSATLLDEQLLTAGTPRRLGPRGSLQFGRVIVEYHQQALPATLPPPVEPPAGEPTLVLKRASVVIPQALLSQMSPVRVDAPEPAGPPPTLSRLPRLMPSAPSAAAKPSPPPPSRPSPPPPPAELDSPPTFIRPNRPPPPAELDSPPTVIRANRPPPPAASGSSPRLVKPDSAPPPADLVSPPTLIRPNPLPAPAGVEPGPPPTVIRRNQPPPVPPSPTAGPAPAVRSVPRPAAQSGPLAAAQRGERA
ncbi:MAG TPA: FHA domain-containing protein, partial [Pseudomonadota bacterium]|nr:FHA domain-containing protein [Pseudomonadota bacterium]